MSLDGEAWSGGEYVDGMGRPHNRPLLRLGNGMGMLVLDRTLASRFTANRPYAILSITDPGSSLVTFKPSECLVAVHRTTFCDADSEAMTGDIARGVAHFVTGQVVQSAELLVVHCEAGVSRSAGMALAIGEWASSDYPEMLKRLRTQILDNYSPNRFVVRAMRDHLGIVTQEKAAAQEPKPDVTITRSTWHPNHPLLPEGTSTISFSPAWATNSKEAKNQEKGGA